MDETQTASGDQSQDLSQAAQPAGTPGNGGQTPLQPTPQVGNGDSQQDSGAATSGTDQELAGETHEQKVEKALAEYGKLPEVQKEYQSYKEQAEKDRQLLNQLRQAAIKDESTFRQVMTAMGHNSDYINQQAQQLRQRGVWSQQPNNQGQQPQGQGQYQQQPQVNAADLKNELKNELRSELEMDKVAERVFQAYPHIAQAQGADAQRENELVQKSFYMAQARLQVGLGSDLGDEVIKAYGEISGRSADEIAHAREQGKREGIAIGTGAKVSANPPAAGSQSKVDSVQLSDAQREAAKYWGMTDAEYAESMRSTGQIQ